MKQYDESTELLIELLEGALQEEGYETVRYSNSKIYGATAYDVLEIKRDDEYFSISIDKKEDYRRIDYEKRDLIVEKASEAFESIKKELEAREVQGNE